MSGTADARRPAAAWFAEHAQVLAIAGFLLLCCVGFTLAAPVFLTPGNLLNLLRQSAPSLLVAVAMTFVITTGGIDLSVGSIVALSGALAAILLRDGVPWPLAVAALLAGGGLVGAVQGWFIAWQRIPAFIVTLAGLSVLRGLALLLTEGFSIPIPVGSGFAALGRGWVAGVPIPAALALLVALAAHVALREGRYGRQVVAVGANAEAARRAGMPERRVVASTYVLTGMAAAAAGLVIAARLGSGSANAAVGFELDVIAAVVLGGTSLMGGSGSVVGTVLGALAVAVIGNGLILCRVSPFLTGIVTGAILLLAVWLNARVFGRLGRTR